MKRIILLTGLIMFGVFNAQIKFEKGYFINNSGQKNEVLIKNLDWKNNPTEFEYKTEENSKVNKETIKNIQEFSVGTNQKFIREDVSIDTSSEDLNKISSEKNPVFIKQTVFLKYIIEGKASLLSYTGTLSNTKRYFYTVDKNKAQQLIYKPYLVENNQITYNDEYKKQILTDLKCDINNTDISSVNYKQKDLTNIFIKYNECSNAEVTNFSKVNKKKDLVNLSIRPGVVFSSFDITNYYDRKIDFGSQTTFRLGLELEFILPFNKNKWSIFVEPNYQYFKANTEFIINEKIRERSIDYKAIQIPIGIRHYFFINDKSKIFLNIAGAPSISLSSKIVFSDDPKANKTSTGVPMVLGAGYKYNDKFGVEFRYSNESLINNYLNWDSSYKTVSVILGYTLF